MESGKLVFRLLIQMLRFIILGLLALSFISESADLYMTDLVERKYFKSTNGANLQYLISANRKERNLTINKDIKFLMSEDKRKHFYLNGKLILEDSTYYFEKAYWHKGDIILKKAHGNLTDLQFSTNKLTYNPHTNSVFIEHLFIFNDDTFSKIRNYTHVLSTN